MVHLQFIVLCVNKRFCFYTFYCEMSNQTAFYAILYIIKPTRYHKVFTTINITPFFFVSQKYHNVQKSQQFIQRTIICCKQNQYIICKVYILHFFFCFDCQIIIIQCTLVILPPPLFNLPSSLSAIKVQISRNQVQF